MPHLTTEQRVFLVQRFFETKNCNLVLTEFRNQFPDRNPPPTRATIYKNVRKYKATGTSKNLHKERCGRKRTGRSEENIAAVSHLLQVNPEVSVRRNPLQLPISTFSRIVNSDLGCHPYKIHIRHQLQPRDLVRRDHFCRWFGLSVIVLK